MPLLRKEMCLEAIFENEIFLESYFGNNFSSSSFKNRLLCEIDASETGKGKGKKNQATSSPS